MRSSAPSDVGHSPFIPVDLTLFFPPGVPWNFSFNVKFYPPDPAQLSEDITRCPRPPPHPPVLSRHCSQAHLRQRLPVCLQVFPVSPAEAGHRFWTASLLVCHSHGSGVLHGPVGARRLRPRYRPAPFPSLPRGSPTRTRRHLSVFLRGMRSGLHQPAQLCSQPNQRDGGQNRGAAQDLQVGGRRFWTASVLDGVGSGRRWFWTRSEGRPRV